ncbi:MAG TPA: transglycosylase SLT domain-containing protein [Thermoanaerobaculia bacterium]|nr:transglycosylase SLT domain-containing protein [Thermoanaerobaculia bacterium]
MRRSTLSLIVLGFFLFVAVLGALLERRVPSPLLLTATAVDRAARPAAPPAGAEEQYAAAATHFRSGDLEQVRQELRRLAADQPEEAQRALTVLGLYEFASGNHQEAVAVLRPLEGGPHLEDWRLYALVESGAELEDEELTRRALEALVDQSPPSPLSGPALLSAARLAWNRGAGPLALSYVDMARRQQVAGDTATALETLGWKVSRAVGDREAQRQAAKQLLVHAPVQAAELRVGDLFADQLGRIDSWDGVLEVEQVKQRARSWIATGRGLSAQHTLNSMADAQRDLDWHLLKAQSLTQQERGDLAYGVLADAKPRGARETALVEWERARAAMDAATHNRARPGLSATQRKAKLEQAQRHLRRVIELQADAEISAEAVRTVYAHLAEEGRLAESMEMLQLLRHLDPLDRTGASFLWERGWSEYQSRNLESAVQYWGQLEELYPNDSNAHRGTYWKARALEAMDETDAAEAALRRLVEGSDTADFYVRRAAERLGLPGPGKVPGSEAPTWPTEPLLRRVLTLSNFGLDALARLELDLLAQTGATLDRREQRAMRGILTVREGNAREGVQDLRAAYPALGTAYQAEVPKPVLEAYYPLDFQDSIRANAERTGLPASLVAGIIRQESAFDSKATSWAGARGLMQVMPATAKEVAARLGKSHSPSRLYDPDYSILLGSTYFKQVLDRFDGNVELALAGYNGGPNRIRRLWREAGGDTAELDLFLETLGIQESQIYVKRILVLADSYRFLYPGYQAPQPPAATPPFTG